MDIPGAFAKLRTALGGDLHIIVRPPEIDSYGFDNALKVKEWEVYLGSEAPNGAHGTHQGNTLAEAVNAALAACEPPVEPDATAAAAAVTQAFAEPLPY